MKEATIELDSKGILPKDGQSEKEFIDWGEQLLWNAYEFKHESKQKDNYLDLSDEVHIFDEIYDMSPDWIVGFEEYFENRTISGLAKIIDYCGSKIPYVAIDPEIPYMCTSVKFHEMMHCIRVPLKNGFLSRSLESSIPWKPPEDELEEYLVYGFENYLNKCAKDEKMSKLNEKVRSLYFSSLADKIAETSEMLEEDFSPVLIRLRPDEIGDLADVVKDNELDYSLRKKFANRSSLRAKIILEKYF